MGLGKANSLYLLSLLCCLLPVAADRAEGSPSPPETFAVILTGIEYSTGTVEFGDSAEVCAPDRVLEASTPLGILELIVFGAKDGKCHALCRDPDLLALFQPGDELTLRIRSPEATGELPPDIANLLEDLESLEDRVNGLIESTTEEERPTAISTVEAGKGRWWGDVGIRVGYDRFSRSGLVIIDLDPKDRESVERALAELEELIRRAREVPGIDQSELDRAEELALEAREILRDPAGDLEAAAGNIIAAQIIVEAAVERAGQNPDAIQVRDFRGEVDDTLEGYAFVNARRSFLWGKTGKLSLDEHAEGGSRFLAEDFLFRAERDLSRRIRMGFESDSSVRIYREDFADDVFAQGLDLEVEAALLPQMQVGLGGDYVYRKEFDTFSDDGYHFGGPRAWARYRLERWGLIEARLRKQWREYRDPANSDLDHEADLLNVAYTYFGPRVFFNLVWDRIDRDADLPFEEDDYTEDTVSVFYSYRWRGGIVTGIEARITDRDYTTTGPYDPVTGGKRGEDNTDFLAWSVRPFFETRWSRSLTTTVDYQYVRLENRDRVPEDDIDKSLGDYDLHRVTFSIQWYPSVRWDVFLRQELETRDYVNGETGTFEIWFADFRNLADYDSATISVFVVRHLTSALDLELEAFHSRERYPTFSELDTDQTALQAVLRYSF